MQLFSKRYSYTYGGKEGPGIEEFDLISTSLKKRLQEEIKYIIHSNEFIEKFLVVFDEDKNEYSLHETILREVSCRINGNDVTIIIDCKTLDFDQKGYNDAYLFDLIELMIIFSEKQKRNEIKKRFKDIFSEENEDFNLYNFIIFRKKGGGVSTISPLIKDPQLRNKFEEYYKNDNNLKNSARLSADIMQILFSSPINKEGTKKFSENLCNKIAQESTKKNNVTKLALILSDTVKNCKKLNNQISNVRHTDRHTIVSQGASLYKLIQDLNMAVVELVITSIPNEFIISQNPDRIKKEYLNKYKIDPKKGWIIKKAKVIDVNDIPF